MQQRQDYLEKQQENCSRMASAVEAEEELKADKSGQRQEREQKRQMAMHAKEAVVEEEEDDVLLLVRMEVWSVVYLLHEREHFCLKQIRVNSSLPSLESRSRGVERTA